MKAPSPAFSFYPKDIESDETCKAMTHAEFGMYIRLLMNCWTEGSIPAEPKRLQRLLGISARTFASAWPSVAPCFSPGEEGRLVQSRLEIERKKQVSRSRENSENGGKGGRPRKSNESAENGKRTVSLEKASGEEIESEPKGRAGASSPSPSSVPERTDPGRVVKAESTATPDGTPGSLSAIEPTATATAPRRLTPKALGIRVDPANFAQVQLSHDLTALVEVVRKNHARFADPEKFDPVCEALGLLHDISTTPAGKRIETLDLRRVSRDWAAISSHAAYKLAREVYGIELDPATARATDTPVAASGSGGEGASASGRAPSQEAPKKLPSLTLTVAPGACPVCSSPLRHSTEGGETVLRCDQETVPCEWAAVWRSCAA